jgi:hypothetical protein
MLCVTVVRAQVERPHNLGEKLMPHEDTIKELLQALAEAIEVIDIEKHTETFNECCVAYKKHANGYIHEHKIRMERKQ